ncbi:PAS domain-containing protein, partial [Thermodesulfobacteriota bacterium]
MARSEQEDKTKSGLLSRFNIRFEREGLAGHIGLILLAVALIIIIAITLMTTTLSKRISRAELFNDSVSLTKASAISIAKAMESGEMSQVSGILKVIAARSKVNYCMVLDTEGKVVACSSEKLIGTVFDDPVMDKVHKSIGLFSQDYVDGAGREIQDFYYPINGSNDWLGTFRLGIAYDFPVISWSNKRYSQVLAATALFVFTILSFVYYLVRLLFRPLSSIRSQLELLLKNREVKSIKLDRSGEFKDMADKWNALLNIVSENYKEIETLNADLEISNRLFLFEKRRNEIILDNVQSGLICVNGTGNVVCVNRAAGSLLRFPAENLLDQDIQKVISIPRLSEFINTNIAD